MIIEIKLGKTYYYDAKINIPTKAEHLIGKDKEIISVQLGKKGNSFERKVNRATSPLPRIELSNEYSNWVQTEYKLGDKMKVEIVNPNSIILYAKEEH